MSSSSENIFDDIPLDFDLPDSNFDFINNDILTGDLGNINDEEWGQTIGFGNFDMVEDIGLIFGNEGSSNTLISPQSVSSVNSLTFNNSNSSSSNHKNKKRKNKKISKSIPKKRKKNSFYSTFTSSSFESKYSELKKKYKPLSTIIPNMNFIKNYYKIKNEERKKLYNTNIKLRKKKNELQIVSFLKNDAEANFTNVDNFLKCFLHNNFNLDYCLIDNKLSIQVLLTNFYFKDKNDFIKLQNIIFYYLEKNNKLFHFIKNRSLFNYYICYGNILLLDRLIKYLIDNDIERDIIKNEIINSKNEIIFKTFKINRKSIISKLIKNLYKFKCSDSEYLEIEYKKNIDFLKKKNMDNYLILLKHPFNDKLLTIELLIEWLKKGNNIIQQKNINVHEYKQIIKYIFNYHNKNEIFPDDFRTGFILWIKKKMTSILSKKYGLLNHQSIAISYINSRKETFIADDMGLGKTASSIVATFSNKSIKNVLVICPPVLINHWIKELNKWSEESNENICIYDKKYIPPIRYVSNNNKKNYLIVSHSYFLYYDIQRTSPRLLEYTTYCDCMILDELHTYSTGKKWFPRLIEWTNKVNKSCKIIALSGTPIRQYLYEMSYLLQILRFKVKKREDILYLSSLFLSTTIRRTKKMILKGDIKLPSVKTKEVYLPLDTISKKRYSMIRSILGQFRRTKGKEYIPLGTFCLLRQLCVCFDSLNEEIKILLKGDTLNEKQRRIICNRLEGIKDNGEDCSICLNPLENVISDNCSVVCTNPCGHAFHKKCIEKWFNKNKKCPLCRQLITNLILSSTFYNDSKKIEEGSNSKKKTIVPKFEWIVKKCKEEEEKENKFIVFSEFIRPLKLLKEYLDNNNINSCLVIGSDKNTDRLIESFKNEKKIQVLLATKKCSVGLNLTVANRVIFLSVPLSVNIDKQSKDRINRIGQKKEMEITYLITEDSFEVTLMKKLKEKSKAIDDFYNGALNVTPEQFERALSEFKPTLNDLDN
jgi:SNF2 family DNA or RNA helicase